VEYSAGSYAVLSHVSTSLLFLLETLANAMMGLPLGYRRGLDVVKDFDRDDVESLTYLYTRKLILE
jgi:mannose/fructose/N-acetylgalactosamine-specific phosphotransferase system component IID